MPIYHRLGRIPPKRHIAHPREDGGLHYEELMGNRGFVGPSSLLYHLRPPTAVREVELLRQVLLEPDPDQRVRHRHLRTAGVPVGGSPTLDRLPLLFNQDVTLSVVVADLEDPHFYRNASADELVFVVEGEGVLASAFGELRFRPGEQIIIPRGILHQWKQRGAMRLLCIEARGPLRWPARYRNDCGQLLEGAPYSERDIQRPSELQAHDERGPFELLVKQHGAITRIVLDHHPFDVVGWDGYYYPWAISIHDFEPIVGRVHQPPPVHQLLAGDGLVICNFCPRPFDFHPQAIPVPYAHSNVMSDEVLFYVSGEFMSRKGIEVGSLTLHPDGIPHGPHPGRYEGSVGATRTSELAVMMDTERPLQVTRQALELEDADYYRSWLA